MSDERHVPGYIDMYSKYSNGKEKYRNGAGRRIVCVVNQVASMGWKKSSDDGHLDPILFQGILGKFGNTLVGDDLVNVLKSTDASETALTELGGVCQDNCFLRNFDHFPVQMGLHYIGSRQPKIK